MGNTQAQAIDWGKGIRVKHGKLQYRITYRGQKISRVTDLEAVPKNKEAAIVARAKAIQELRRTNKRQVRKVPVGFDEAVTRYIAYYEGEHNTDSRWCKDMMSNVGHFFAHEHPCKLSSVSRGDIEDYKAWRRSNGNASNTLRKKSDYARRLFAYGRRMGWLEGNPLEDVKIPAEQESEAMRVISSPEEVAYLSEAMRQGRQDVWDIATIMAYQGPRPSEVMSLARSNVDLERQRFTIWFSTTEGKTKNAHRTLKMTPHTLPIFERRMKSTSGTWLFPSAKIANGHLTTIQKAHEKILRGMPQGDGSRKGGCGLSFRIYDLRHTFATRFAMRGGQLPLLSMILGHSTMDMLNLYIHPSQDDMDRAMDAFSGSFPVVAREMEGMLVDYKVGR